MILFANAAKLESTRTHHNLVAAFSEMRKCLETIMKKWDHESASPALDQRIFRTSTVVVPDLPKNHAVWTVHTRLFWHTWSHRIAVSISKPRGFHTPEGLLLSWYRALTALYRHA